VDALGETMIVTIAWGIESSVVQVVSFLSVSLLTGKRRRVHQT
jgi:uncharacterized membrane protein YjfL (UPF0719 family)